MALNERSEILLKSLIERHISDGEAVGSQTLAKESELSLSPATIRNVMAELEDKGYLTSLHTSSGRVPTTKGYRLFIEDVITANITDTSLTEEIKLELAETDDMQSYVKKAGDAVSKMSHYAGIVLVPTVSNAKIRHVDFLELNPKRVLVIIVTNDGQVTNNVVQLKQPINDSALVAASNFFNEQFTGKTFAEVRKLLLKAMADDTSMMDELMRSVVEVAQPILEKESRDEVYVSGEEQLLEIPDLLEMSRLRALFTTFKTKQDLFELLDRCINGEGINIFIGEESGHSALTDFSMITAPYQNENTIGVLGVIGPRRMQYNRVIPMVDITARLLTLSLAREKLES